MIKMFKMFKHLKLKLWSTKKPFSMLWKKSPVVVVKWGKGHYYEFHDVENQKEHQKICKPSLHRNVAFSWSLLRHHYNDKKRLLMFWFYLWH